jgi:hypothetical protein
MIGQQRALDALPFEKEWLCVSSLADDAEGNSEAVWTHWDESQKTKKESERSEKRIKGVMTRLRSFANSLACDCC